MEPPDPPNWNDYFMTMVYLVASKSKDRKTHIGAVIVDPENRLKSTGYNNFVRGLNDNVDERYGNPEKYHWFEHAERNAIYSAGPVGVSLKGCRVYTNGIPCTSCARAIIQSGIEEVIVDKKWNDDNSERWKDEARRSLQMFDEVGVQVRYWTGNFVKLHKFRGGKKTSLE